MTFALIHRTHRLEGNYDVLDTDEEIPGRALWLQAVRGAHGRAARACCPNGFGRNEVRLIPSDFSLPDNYHWELWQVSCTEGWYSNDHVFWKFALWPVPNGHSLRPGSELWSRYIEDDIDPANVTSTGNDWAQAQMINESAFLNLFEPGDGTFNHVHIAVLLDDVWTPPRPQDFVDRAAEQERQVMEMIRQIMR